MAEVLEKPKTEEKEAPVQSSEQVKKWIHELDKLKVDQTALMSEKTSAGGKQQFENQEKRMAQIVKEMSEKNLIQNKIVKEVVNYVGEMEAKYEKQNKMIHAPEQFLSPLERINIAVREKVKNGGRHWRLNMSIPELTPTVIERYKALTSAANFVGNVPPPYRIPGIHFDPSSGRRIRDIIPSININVGATFEWAKRTALANEPGPIAEDTTPTEITLTVSQISYAIQSIKGIINYSRIMETDTDANVFSTFIYNQLVDLLTKVENAQIINGSGTAPNIIGFFNTAASNPFPSPSDYDNKIVSANIIDVMIAMIGELNKKFYNATHVVMNPLNFFLLHAVKDTNAQYVVNALLNGLPATIFGALIVSNHQMGADNILVGDFVNGSIIGQREVPNVTLGYNADDFAKGNITALITERLALGTFQEALMRGVISTIITALTPA